MIIHDPGHKYQLEMYNGNYMSGDKDVILTFMKREGKGYPGNVGRYAGTNVQEVLRALIDRIEYLDNQIHDDRNDAILENLRRSLYMLEERAADRHRRQFSNIILHDIERYPTCPICGHIGCSLERH